MWPFTRKKPAPPPVPVAEPAPGPSLVVRASGTAGTGRSRASISAEQVMSIAVEECAAAGKGDDASMTAAIAHARAMWKQARTAANYTGKDITFEVGTRKLVMKPDVIA